jgi:hypothetical protein
VFASIPHILRGFDRWDELEDDIGNTSESNDDPKDIVHNVLVEENGTDENVDYRKLILQSTAWYRASTYRFLAQ